MPCVTTRARMKCCASTLLPFLKATRPPSSTPAVAAEPVRGAAGGGDKGAGLRGGEGERGRHTAGAAQCGAEQQKRCSGMLRVAIPTHCSQAGRTNCEHTRAQGRLTDQHPRVALPLVRDDLAGRCVVLHASCCSWQSRTTQQPDKAPARPRQQHQSGVRRGPREALGRTVTGRRKANPGHVASAGPVRHISGL